MLLGNKVHIGHFPIQNQLHFFNLLNVNKIVYLSFINEELS